MNFIDYYNSRKKEEKPTTFTGFVNNSRLKEYETAKQEAIDRYVAEQSKNMSHTADMNQRAEQRVSKAKQYENLKNNSDFAENSINKLGKGQTFDEVSRAWQNSQITPYGDDQFIGADKKIYHISELQDYQDKNKYEINDKLTTYLDAVESGENVNSLQEDGKDTWGSLMYEGEQKRWSYLNDDEKKNYYYLYNTQGKNAAYQYLTDMEYDLGMRENTEQQEKLKDAKWYEEILYNVASIPANVYGGAIAAIGDVSNIIQGKEINPYSTSHRAMNFAQNVRTDTAEKLQVTDSEIANQIFANTYQAVMSSLDSALGAATLGNGYTVAMGMGAASQRASEMWQNGATQEQIVGGAIASGLIEWWTEKYSFDQITDGLWKNAVSTGDILKAIGMGALVEGFEEVHADALNLAADALIMGANSNHESRVRELMAQGMSEGQARNQATKEAALDMFWSFYGGFVSGGLFSVEQGVVKGNEIKGNISKYNQSYSGNNTDLITEGKELGNNYAKKFDANKDLSSGQRAKIIQGNTRIIQQNDAQSINMAVKSRLESLGVKDNLNEMAGYITKSYVNQFGGDQYLNIESSEKKAFNNNKIAQQVKNELFNATTKNFNDTSSRWTSQADTTYTTPDAFDTQRELQNKENEIISKSIGVDTNAVKTLAQQENISEDEAYIRQASKDLNINPALVGSLVKGYDSSKLSAGKYILGMQEAIRYGEYGYSLSALPKNSFTKNLSNSQLSMGYNLGKALSNDSVAKAQENTKQVSKKAKISYHPSVNQKNLTKDQKAQIKVLTQINKDSAKAEIVLFASKDGKLTQDMFGRKAGDVAPNGAYYNGKIYIDVNAGNSNAGLILNTGSHEYVHYIASNDYKGFVDLAHALADVMEKKGFNVDQYVRTKAEKQNISYRAAYEEWVADSMQSLLTDVDVIEKLETIKANNKNAWEKIKDFFLKIFEQLKDFFNSNFAVESLEGQMVQGLKNLEDYQKIADYFTKGLVESGKQSADDGSIAFSLRENENITNRSISYYEDNKKGSASHISQETFNEANDNVNKMVKYMSPYLDLTNNNGRRYLPEEILGKTTFSNGSYGKTIENTTICFRTLSYIDFTNEIKKKIGRPLTVEESFLASQMLYDIAKEPQCLYCYVSLDRKSYDGFLLQYIEQRDETIKKFIALEDKSKANIDNLYNEFLNGRKPTPQMRNRFNLWINSVINGKELIKLSDLTTEEIRASLKQGELADQINDAERYAQGASWAKKLEQYRSYNSDLLRMSQKMVNKLNAHYGLRFYSFSEYTPAFIVENMQQIRDASLKGLYGLAYTKKPDFARVFANTGMNINISVFGKMEDGKVIPDTRQGAEWEEVQELRKQFKNVGAVFVATSDELTEWALAQDWIDVVIPFHIVRTGANVAEFYKWTNNTAFQADKDGAGKNKTISPAEHHNDLATFKRLVEERGLTPRFEKFKDNPNYMKLVNETRLSDLESKKLTPIFDLNAAKKSFDTFVEDGGYYGNWYNEGINYKDAVDIVAEDVLAGKRANEVKYGRQDEKVEYDINELIKRHKTRNKPNNRVHGQALLSDRDDAGSNLGYHAGDLGKSQVDDYWKQGYSRNSGHFGFGTYFVGNESQINDGIYGERKHESVDFSKYNLYKPSSSEKAYKLHDALRVIDGYIEVYSKYANQSKDDFDEWKNDLRDAALNLRDESFDDFDDDDSFIEGIMSRKTLDEFYDEYLSDYEKSQVESQAEKIHKKLNDSNYTIDLIRYQEIAKYIDSAIAEEEWLWGKLNKLNDDLYSALEGKVSKADIGEALKKTENVVATYERNVRGYDSAATVFMKALGYEGVDVRGTSLDNTGYGSVIYDLKGEDLARKKEIGTARFSDRDSQGNILTKEQQEYFKDSKVRDENGNLLVLYHGTLGDFTTFDTSKKSNGKYFGDGIYLTDSYDGAESFLYGHSKGKVMELYANITNPLIIDRTSTQLANTIREFFGLRKNAKLYLRHYTEYINSKVWNDRFMIRDHSKDVPNYDGVIVNNSKDANGSKITEYVVFDPNQVKETANKTPTSDPDIRYSIREEALKEIDNAINDLNYRNDVYLTETSPLIIAKQKGAKNLPMLMNASHIRINVLTEEEAKSRGFAVNKKDHYHGLGKDLFVKIIDGLDDVELAYRGTKNAKDSSRRENYFLLISQYKDAKGNIINVPIYINEKGQYNRVFIDTNKVATVFGRDDFFEYINKELKEGNLVRIKKRSIQTSERAGVIPDGYNLNTSYKYSTLTSEKSQDVDEKIKASAAFADNTAIINAANASKNKLSQSSNNVNGESKKYSSRDAEYLELAKNPEANKQRLRALVENAARQAGYDSPILYHGSPNNGFTTFDKSKFGSSTRSYSDAVGFYFSDNKDYAEQFSYETEPYDSVLAKRTGKKGEVREFYLNMLNPLDFNNLSEEIKEKLYEISSKNYLSKEEFLKGLNASLSVGNHQRAKDFIDFDKISSLGYDGVIARMDVPASNSLEFAKKELERKQKELKELEQLADKPSYYEIEREYLLRSIKTEERIIEENQDQHTIDLKESLEYMVFDPSQIKSADLVTYGNDGNIIPLSERFNSNVDDIRFSERGNGYDGYSMSNNARTAYANGEMPLSKWNKEAIIQGVNEINPDINVDGLTLPTLRERFLRQSSWHHTSMYYNKTDFYSLNKGFIEGLTQADVDNIKPVVVSRVQRDASVDSMVEDAYNKIQILVASGKYATESSAATRLLQGANIDSLYQAALESIKAKDKAKVDQWRRLPADHYRAEYVNLYDNDIEAYAQKEYGGRTLSKNSIMFKKMRDYFKPQFSERTESFDPRTVLSNALTDTAQNEKEKQLLAQYKQGIELINKKEKELKQVKKKIHDIMFTKGSDRSGLADLQARSKALENDINRYDKKLLTLQSTQALKDVFVRERDKYIKQGREQAKNVYVGYLERAEKTALKSKIKLIREDLVSRFLDKGENRHYVPQALASEIIDICNMIDPTGERQNTKVAEKYRTTKTMLNELRSRYDELKGFEDYDFSSEFSEEFSSLINQLAKEIGDVPVRNMSPEQLEDVLNILSDIRYMLRDATKQIGKAEAITNYQAGQEIIDNMEMLKAKGITNSAIMEFTRNWTTNPMRAVREMTGYIPDARLNVLFEDLNVGRRKADSFKMDVTKKFQSLIDTNKQAYVDMIEKPVTLNNVKDINGNPLRITKAQAMSYLLTWERENVNEKRNHLDGGAAFLNPDYLIKGNYAKARDTAQVIGAVTQDIIAELSSIMNDFDKAYMDLTREFFRETSTKAVNETTLLTKHRIVAEEKNYFPYSVDSNFIATENENVQYNATIEGMGMLKSVKPYASQQLIMDNVNTIIDRHLNKVATLYGLAVPVRNINKALNMKQTFEDGGNSVKNAISNTWGSRAIDNNSVILKAIADVQSPRRSNNVSMFAFAKGVMVQTTLNANISVWLKQFASYPTAGAYLSANSLAKGLSYFGKTKQLFNEIDEHTSQHYIRRLGLSTIELGDINLTQGWQNKLNKKLGKMSPMNWIQAMDVATTAMLWVACKEEIKSSGINEHSKEYWEEVTKLYDKVVEDTQPMYDPLHRAEVTKADGLKNLIMFQTQPIQNSGIIREAFVGLKTAKKMYGTDSSEYESAKKVMAKSIASQLASHLTFTIFTAIAGVVLHKMKPYKDDDGELTPESFFVEFIKKFGYNVFSAFVPVVGSMITSLIDNISNGTNYDILTDATVDKINSTINTFRKTFTNPNLNNFKSLAIEILSYLGIPAGNVYNIVNGLILNAKDIINGEPFSFKAE